VLTEVLDVTGNILASGSLIASSVIVGSTNLVTEITALQGRLDTEEPKTTALQTLTATHTEDVASNTNNIASLDVDLFTKQQK
jgi:hypothetical protein